MATSSVSSSKSSPCLRLPAGPVSCPGLGPTLTTQQREPPLRKKPYTAFDNGVLAAPSETNSRTNWVQLSNQRIWFVGASAFGAAPTNPGVLVPTASIGRAPVETSSTS